MNKKLIKKEIALFLLAGYETAEIAIKFIVKNIVLCLTITLFLFIVMFTLVYLEIQQAVVIPFLFTCVKFGVPTTFLSATITRYLLA